MEQVSSVLTPTTLSRQISPGGGGFDADLQLCFNKTHFDKQDFNVERFLGLARRRATLDQIHNDLRVYLRFLQTSMIELINDRYADFVNLSSNLAALNESIDKVTTNIETSWKAFASSTLELEKSARSTESKCGELVSIRKQQIHIRNKIRLIGSLERLSRRLHSAPTSINHSWLVKLSHSIVDVELWSERLTADRQQLTTQLDIIISNKAMQYAHLRDFLVDYLTTDIRSECSCVAALHSILSLLDGVDTAISKVVDRVIKERIRVSNCSNKDLLLKALFGQINDFRAMWVNRLRSQSQFTEAVGEFIDLCLLRYISEFLDEEFGSVLVPINNRLFHKCYSLTIDFIRCWHSSECANSPSTVIITALQSIKTKFNTFVYFKITTQQFLLDFRAYAVKPEEFSFISTAVSNNETKKAEHDSHSHGCICPLSDAILSAISTCFSDDVFLVALVDKFWDFTLKALTTYLEWTSSVISYFTKEVTPEENGGDRKRNNAVSTIEAWLALTALAFDTSAFDSSIFDLCLSRVWSHLHHMNIDPTPFGRCLSAFSEELTRVRSEIQSSIVTLLLAKITTKLSGVSDIPKQYRWTKKPVPTCFSPYLEAAFSLCERFKIDAIRIGWNEKERLAVLKQLVERSASIFCDLAEQVLDSVEQTGSSLQRFKKKVAQQSNQTTSDEITTSTDTDEAKIRVQLMFDVEFVQQRASECQITSLDRLERLRQRMRENK